MEADRWEDLHAVLNEVQLKQPKILIIGDAVLDRYTYGEINRISPEAPVPVIDALCSQQFLGGAAHVANIVKKLGGRPSLIYGVGYDDAGRTLSNMIGKAGIVRYQIFDAEGTPRKTTLKHRVFAGTLNGKAQPIYRLDNETRDEWFDETSADEIKEWLEHQSLDDPFKAIIVSDYDKGFVTENHYNVVRRFSLKHNIPLIVDPKYKRFFRYKDAWVMTPNRKEVLAAFSDRAEPDEYVAAHILTEKHGFDTVLMTLGKEGIAVVQYGFEKIEHIPSDSQGCISVSGAGDTITAAFSLAYSLGDFSTFPRCNWLTPRAASFASFCAGIAVDHFPIRAVSEADVRQRLEELKQNEESQRG